MDLIKYAFMQTLPIMAGYLVLGMVLVFFYMIMAILYYGPF